MFEKEYEIFWNKQVRQAQGQRLDMLGRDLTGTKKLLEVVLLPVLGTFEGLELEFEMISLSGVKIYGDVCHPKLRKLASLCTLRKLQETGSHSKGHGREVSRCLGTHISRIAEMSLRKRRVSVKETCTNGLADSAMHRVLGCFSYRFINGKF
ncbi:hypothetical protein PAECIP111891_00034 [Paenibacillus allorhizoplanae]|uniref:Uncharacterized protein n=1 Tax=Paenibacillus allorhizoplanae TaxID=2905648 RepID=A0ABM9BNQ5_9BACL|nr:hypothetical protein [Paenibacillus allorhizoplanae]CAH1191586.1 hypothetical protein PAECIP111891_00034 [Paenibacillus allorhizoplanae]